MSLKAGSSLAHYRLIEPIGEGGMGTVWRARDTRLDRDVAIKIVRPDRTGDAGFRARLEREAKALAALSHPNVAAIHGLESFRDGRGRAHALILELVPGESLAERVTRGPLPPGEALEIAARILDGLSAAHDAGIVHRDLKPENVRVTPDGRVKILDFGIARELPGRTGGGSSDEGATVTSALTAAGAVLGTPRYMSPEQTRGAPVGTRSDLWSFGCLLFEMMTGKPAFPAPTVADTIAAILSREPDLAAIEEPAREVVRRCLVKDPASRDIDARQARGLLTPARGEPSGIAAGPRPRLTQETWGDGIDGFPAWSPDGRELVYAAESGRVRRIVRTRVGSGSAVPITEGDADEIMPAWSPDGSTVLFVRARETGRRLEPRDVFGIYEAADVWAADLATGRSIRLVEQAFNPSFSPDGRSIALDASWAGPRRIWLVDARGRNPVQASTDVSEAVSHHRPRFSPDGNRLVFQSLERTRFNVEILDLATRRSQPAAEGLWSDLQPVWSPSGRFVYFSSYRSGGLNIWRVPVSAGGAPAGAPEQITNGAGQDVEIACAPDGRRLAFAILRQNASLWVLPVVPETGRPAGAPRPLTSSGRDDSRGAWSPDGNTIAFNSMRGGDMNVWLCRADGGEIRALTEGPGGDYQPAWSPDAALVAFFSSRRGSPGIWTAEVATGRLACLSEERAIEINPCYSPDGSHIAYQSDRDGRLEVWVMRADGGGARQLTRCGVMGHFLRFAPDGRHVIFRCPSAGATLRVPLEGGEPEPMGKIAGGSHMSLSPDARRIMDVVAHKVLWVSPVDGDAAEPVFEFEDPEVRIDYPTWSPDGRSVLFDRFLPRGGELWILEGVE
ncbi:MAG: serine/threonine-protein kinase [Acidobacteriia bacterium]|nr:serine/threonine-protein kinase [Terriglobia bacterium]